MNNRTRKIVIAALLATLCCIATMIIKIPSPLKGYLNLGDCIVLISGWLLPVNYGFLAAGIGSALADLFSGYVMYAPITFLVKGCMAVAAFYGFKGMHKTLGNLAARMISGIVAEVIMILGYYIFEGFMYGFIPSAVNIPANGVQGIAGLIIGVILIKVMEKRKITID